MDVYLVEFRGRPLPKNYAEHPTYLLMARDDWEQMKKRVLKIGFVLHNRDRKSAVQGIRAEDRALALQHPGQMFTSNCLGQGEALWVPATRESIREGQLCGLSPKQLKYVRERDGRR